MINNSKEQEKNLNIIDYDLFFVAAVAETIQKIDSLFDDLTSKKDREDEIHSIDYFKLVSLDD